jgi:lipoprotein-releasing system ATP-binding protein
MTGVAVDVDGVGRTYHKAGREIRVLRDVSLRMAPGDRVAILGPSGSGKSTFLHLLGLLDRPSAGVVRLDGHDVGALDEHMRDRLRSRTIGFVFQQHHLLPEHDALANVSVPVRLAGGSTKVANARAEALLRAVGLGDRLTHRPGELSGGEQQRVAIARALVMTPGLLLADEPTGNLDPDTAGDVFRLLLDLHEQLGSTLVVVTHSRELARHFPRQLELRGGVMQEAA